MNCLKPFHSMVEPGKSYLARISSSVMVSTSKRSVYMNTRSGNSPARFMSANTRYGSSRLTNVGLTAPTDVMPYDTARRAVLAKDSLARSSGGL